MKIKKKSKFFIYIFRKNLIFIEKAIFMKTILLVIILIALYPYFVDGFKLLIWHIASLLSFIVKAINNAAKRLSK